MRISIYKVEQSARLTQVRAPVQQEATKTRKKDPGRVQGREWRHRPL